ncbi:vanadium-dependent haloperoxidase [Halothermothrix orenii]|uniref:Phosphoesterase PA-phosphatase related n=1 Tax=Halothermothrix orenii (strain H 168 / OCM 544 / DSM 9562) TaxID=373903 RepID=B8D282_HALOH|nr:vanadium-dependent haloperoxidase [Halothermothrix orenii]ACL69309.1 phosphoesterase PA-phosphatase related [Halothermothrix orenii H 168]
MTGGKHGYKNILGKWSKLPYAGEKQLPVPEEPLAGSWPTFFLKRDHRGRFLDPDGNLIDLKIRFPGRSIDFTGKQLAIVKKTLDNITKEKIKIARYWGTGPPTKQWTPVIDKLIDVYNISATRAGRILGAVQGGLNDARVVAWHLKFAWEIPRPNQLDQKLATVICTPKHPSYPSGHAVVAGCAQIMLTYFFPPKSERLQELAEECAVSRLYDGVHFPVDNEEGLRLGRQIGRLIVRKLKRQRNSEQKRIDIRFTDNKKVKLPPPPYKQPLPFLGETKCNSLILNKAEGSYSLLLWLIIASLLTRDIK